MKKLLILFFFPLFLTACFSSNKNMKTKSYDNADFKIKILKSWEAIDPLELKAIPGVLRAAFKSPNSSKSFSANISIVEESIPSGTSSMVYANSNLKEIHNSIDFQLIEENNIKLNGQKTKITAYKARTEAGADFLWYIQTFAAKGTTGYTVTGAMLPDDPYNEEKNIKTMVKSFKLKNGGV